MTRNRTLRTLACAIFASISLGLSPALAQIQQIDPDTAIDADLAGPDAYPVSGSSQATTGSAGMEDTVISPDAPADEGAAAVDSWSANGTQVTSESAAQQAEEGATYRKDDLMGAAEGVFGKGASGLAGLIEDLLRKQGEPNGYITGREASGAVAVGLRYGSGTLHHKVEGDRPVYWTGPSLGFDLGLNAGKAFVLVYNLYDTQDIYTRFGAGEGQAYFVGGFHVSYLRHGDVVLIPVRVGAGLRLGANIGYMKFSEKQRWLPF